MQTAAKIAISGMYKRENTDHLSVSFPSIHPISEPLYSHEDRGRAVAYPGCHRAFGDVLSIET